jgi:hypothetical protein
MIEYANLIIFLVFIHLFSYVFAFFCLGQTWGKLAKYLLLLILTIAPILPMQAHGTVKKTDLVKVLHHLH